MSGPWYCEKCGRGAEGDRVCTCVLVLQADWQVLRSLWSSARAMRPGDPALLFTDDLRQQLDGLFFAGEHCCAPASVPVTPALGDERCE